MQINHIKINEYPDEHWRVGLAERQKGGAV